MDERGQFTFYRSFWEAINASPKKDKLPLLEAIIKYALDGDEPKSLTPYQLALFLLVKPTLDSSRKKAANGKQGGSKKEANGKQNESKPKQTEANAKQNASEKEREKEKEKEKEKEIENDSSKPKQDVIHCGNLFTSFWESYPKKIDREAAWNAWKTLNPTQERGQQILISLEAWKKGEQWTKDGGQFIPSPANFISKGYWENIPSPAGQHKGIASNTNLGEAELGNIRRLLNEGV